MSLNQIFHKAMDGRALADGDVRFLLDLPAQRLGEWLGMAHALRTAHFGNTLGLCAIINAKSGTCSEDCAFCAQSGHHDANSPVYPLRPVEEIERAGRAAKADGASRFGVVASGKLVGDDDLRGFTEAVRRLRALGLKPDLSPGLLDTAQLSALKAAGLAGYHHNLETSASYFPKMCTTHDYEDDVRAVKAGLKAGLYVCSGGIFGIGETWEDRVELALLLRELGVPSVPINFLIPFAGTPLAHRPILSREEALRIVALYRFLLPDRALRVCGGRSTVFGEAHKAELLTAGMSGMMIGDYLTSAGCETASDARHMRRLGLVAESYTP